MQYAKLLRNRNRKAALNPQESADAIVREYGTPEPEGLNVKERRNRCIRAKSNDSSQLHMKAHGKG